MGFPANGASRICPFCHEPTSATAARCAHCDRRILNLHQRDERKPINCPDCGRMAEIVRIGALEIDLCVACGGLWFDRNELERLPREVSPADLSEGIRTLAVRPSLRGFAAKVYPPCPLCDESMNLAQYQKVSGIVVHQCMTCGIWLDGANAAKFYSLFEQGRMADLEQRAARVTTEELEARLAKLERRQDLPPAPIVGSEPEVVRDLSAVLVFDFLSFLGSLF